MSFSPELQNENIESPETAYAHGFDQFIKTYIQSSDKSLSATLSSFQIELIAASPESELAKAVVRNSDELVSRELKVRAIFGYVEPSDALGRWLNYGSVLAESQWIEEIKWARKPELLDAHEQIILGHSMSWSGDALRRHSQAPYCLDIFEYDCEIKVRMGRLAFGSLWNACSPIPSSLRRKFQAIKSRKNETYQSESKEEFRTKLYSRKTPHH